MKKRIVRCFLALLILFAFVSIVETIALGASGNTKVYVTNYGEKYHSADCHYLAKSCNEISLERAVSGGYGRCSKCNPPTLTSSTSTTTPKIDYETRNQITQADVNNAVEKAVAQAELDAEIQLNEVVENLQAENKKKTTIIVLVLGSIFSASTFLIWKKKP